MPVKKTQRPTARNHRSPRRGRPCSVCQHPERNAIDRSLVTGEPDTIVSAKFRELSDDAVRRHREAHLPAKLAKARDVVEMLEADDLLGQVRTLQRQALGILAKAQQAGDLKTALGAIREARGNLELLARLLGELESNPTVNLLVSPAWLELRATLLRALAPYPAAQQAAAQALLHVG